MPHDSASNWNLALTVSGLGITLAGFSFVLSILFVLIYNGSPVTFYISFFDNIFAPFVALMTLSMSAAPSVGMASV
jgi:hypothetical protein